VTSKPTEDPHDPLPESTFLWRRLTTWVVCVALLVLIYVNVLSLAAMQESAGIVKVTGWLCLLLWIALTYYMVAPSAEQITKVIQLARIWRSGVDLTQLSKPSEAVDTAPAPPVAPAPPPPPPPPVQIPGTGIIE
jgi:hypothetical protein